MATSGIRRGQAAGAALLSAILMGPSTAPAQPPPLPGTQAVTAAGADEILYQGTAIPGSRIEIGPEGPIAPGTSFRWVQVEGPAVALDDTASPRIHFVAPAGARRLTFLMIVRNDRGERLTRVTVPISPAPSIVAPVATAPRPLAATPGPTPIADGGDDQVGLVGRRITLNGGRSRPVGRVGYRWFQVSGPAVAEVQEDGLYYSFVPTGPGLHKFALVVAQESRVSEPDLISVEVGLPPSIAPAPAAIAAAPDSPPLARAVASAVAAIPRGLETASQVADVFEAVAERSSLYKTYGELQSELTRRLNIIIPSEPALRAAWTGQVFAPLSQITTAELMAVGIDPRVPPDSGRPLEPAQKDQLQVIYKGLAAAFRPPTIKP